MQSHDCGMFEKNWRRKTQMTVKANHNGFWRRYLRWCPSCEKKSVQYLKNSKLKEPYKCLNCKANFTSKLIKDV